MPAPYKSPESGNWFTVSLFLETYRDMASSARTGQSPVFSFRAKPGYIDFKSTFIDLADPTGYEWAMKYLSSYDHWLYLMKRDWFQEEVFLALSELQMKIKAKALKRIQELVDSPKGAEALAASKYLAEAGWDKNQVGRPTKERLSGELKALTRDAEQTNDDFERLGLTLIKGGK